MGHYCIRVTMFQSAAIEGISPLPLSFTGSLRVIRRAIPLFQQNVSYSQNINIY